MSFLFPHDFYTFHQRIMNICDLTDLVLHNSNLLVSKVAYLFITKNVNFLRTDHRNVSSTNDILSRPVLSLELTALFSTFFVKSIGCQQ